MPGLSQACVQIYSDDNDTGTLHTFICSADAADVDGQVVLCVIR